MAPRYPTNPNVIKLTLDFRTLDRLKDLARARKVDPTRCAYELLQECLGMGEPLPPPSATQPEPEDEVSASIRRGFAAIDSLNNKPKGNA